MKTNNYFRIRRRGFTMIELLVVMLIMITIVAVTAAAIKVNIDADRVRGAARSLQSYLLGARDRAIYAKQPRGVRLILNAANPRTVSSVVLIQPTDPWNGQVKILQFNTALPWNSTTNPMTRVRLLDNNHVPNWQQLNQRNLLVTESHPRIKIPANNRGVWYVVNAVDFNGTNQDLILTTEYRNPNPLGVYETAQIELPPSVVPNEEPFQLPRNVVIDLDACSSNRSVAPGNKLPNSWKNFPGGRSREPQPHQAWFIFI
jgi:type II secretory pathway pseudopilin PulG